MYNRFYLTIFILICYGFIRWIYNDKLRHVAQAQARPSQLLNHHVIAGGSQFFIRADVVTFIVTAVTLLILALIWLPYIWKRVQKEMRITPQL